MFRVTILPVTRSVMVTLAVAVPGVQRRPRSGGAVREAAMRIRRHGADADDPAAPAQGLMAIEATDTVIGKGPPCWTVRSCVGTLTRTKLTMAADLLVAVDSGI